MITFYEAEELNLKVTRSLTESPAVGATKFRPIGIGKPLVIRLHTVYVGDLKTGIFNKNQDVLVTSVIKDDITYDVPPFGVHQIFDKSKDKELLYPKAINEGTELIYYTKAFDLNRLLFNIEVKADKFDQDGVDGISKALAGASGLPVFMAYAPYMLVGSQLLKIGGEIANKIAGGAKSILSFTYNISQDVGGLRNTKEGFKIGIDPKHVDKMAGYEIAENPLAENIFYLAKNGKKYDGEIPYVIISLDGADVSRYDNFKATIASASLLKKFYGKSDTTLVDDVQKMISVYNDFNYIDKIGKLNKELKKTTEPEKRKELEELLNAYKKNIVNKDVFKTSS
jgi:hypothetical protein